MNVPTAVLKKKQWGHKEIPGEREYKCSQKKQQEKTAGKKGGKSYPTTYTTRPAPQKKKKKLKRRGSDHWPVRTDSGALPLSQPPGDTKKHPRGMIVFHPRGTRQKPGRETKRLRKCWKPLPGDICAYCCCCRIIRNAVPTCWKEIPGDTKEQTPGGW